MPKKNEKWTKIQRKNIIKAITRLNKKNIVGKSAIHKRIIQKRKINP